MRSCGRWRRSARASATWACISSRSAGCCGPRAGRRRWNTARSPSRPGRDSGSNRHPECSSMTPCESEGAAMLYVIHALDKNGEMPTRAKHYRDHRLHLDRAEDYNVDVITAGTLIADDGETPCGSIFVIDAS